MLRESLIKNKKGQMGFFLFFFILIAVVMVLGIFLIFGSSILNYTFDQIVPEIESIGQVGSANVTQAADYTLNPINTLVQNGVYLVGVIYMIMIIGTFGLAISYRATMTRWLLPLFFVFSILMILMSIVLSNIYQDFYLGDDDISSLMREHTLLSFLILHSPVVFTVVIFSAGIVLFSGMNREEFI